VAARRLVIVMLVLLAISTLAAALLPQPDSDEAATDRQRTSTREPPPPANPKTQVTGVLLVARMPISLQRPKTVRIERGDQLRLDVLAPFGADLEIPALGLTGTVTPSAPAQFDLLGRETGRFPVRLVDSGQLAGTVLVGKPDSGRCGVATPATPRGRGTTPPCDRRGKRGSGGSGRSARRS
jgi:hypothetical protein